MGVVSRRRVWLYSGIYGCGCKEVFRLECMGVVSRRRVWLYSGIYGCGCKEVFRYSYYLSLLLSYPLFFAAASLLFVLFFMFSFLFHYFL